MTSPPLVPTVLLTLALGACGVLRAGPGGDVLLEPTYHFEEIGNVPRLEPPLLADDALTAQALVVAKFGDDLPGDLLALVVEVDYDTSFLVDAAVDLCSPPRAENPRLVIDGEVWRVEHSTDADENVLCDAPNRNWLLFVVDREYRPIFEP